MIKTYTYKIKPSKKVEQKFNHWVGICRYVFNVSKQLKELADSNAISISGQVRMLIKKAVRDVK